MVYLAMANVIVCCERHDPRLSMIEQLLRWCVVIVTFCTLLIFITYFTGSRVSARFSHSAVCMRYVLTHSKDLNVMSSSFFLVAGRFFLVLGLLCSAASSRSASVSRCCRAGVLAVTGGSGDCNRS